MSVSARVVKNSFTQLLYESVSELRLQMLKELLASRRTSTCECASLRAAMEVPVANIPVPTASYRLYYSLNA